MTASLVRGAVRIVGNLSFRRANYRSAITIKKFGKFAYVKVRNAVTDEDDGDDHYRVRKLIAVNDACGATRK